MDILKYMYSNRKTRYFVINMAIDLYTGSLEHS